jgi:hypothetical protein
MDVDLLPSNPHVLDKLTGPADAEPVKENCLFESKFALTPAPRPLLPQLTPTDPDVCPSLLTVQEKEQLKPPGNGTETEKDWCETPRLSTSVCHESWRFSRDLWSTTAAS